MHTINYQMQCQLAQHHQQAILEQARQDRLLRSTVQSNRPKPVWTFLLRPWLRLRTA